MRPVRASRLDPSLPQAVGQWATPPEVVNLGTVTPTEKRALFLPLRLRPGTYDAVGCRVVNAQVTGVGVASGRIGLFASETDSGLPDLAAGPKLNGIVDLTVTGTRADATGSYAHPGGLAWLAWLYAVTTAPTVAVGMHCIQGSALGGPTWTLALDATYRVLGRDGVTDWPTSTWTQANTIHANSGMPYLGVHRAA